MSVSWSQAVFEQLGICVEGELLDCNQFLMDQIDILLRILKENKVYLKLNDHDRKTLAEVGSKLSPNNRRECSKIVSPDTILTWHRRLIGKLMDIPKGNKKGYNPVSAEEKKLIIEMAKNNYHWGLLRISGELSKLGFHRCPTTVKNVLIKAGLTPPPYKCRSTGKWERFIKAHKSVWQVDFTNVYLPDFQNNIATKYFIQVFINIRSREVVLGGVTAHPTEPWMQQSARNVSSFELADADLLIRDNDEIYQASFDDIFKDNGCKVENTSLRAPDMNAFIERFMRSLKEECLNHLILLKESQLREVVQTYVSFYNSKRPHQGIGNVPPKSKLNTEGEITCVSQLGGLLNSYERVAA